VELRCEREGIVWSKSSSSQQEQGRKKGEAPNEFTPFLPKRNKNTTKCNCTKGREKLHEVLLLSS
jgi:hypothetical protein